MLRYGTSVLLQGRAEGVLYRFGLQRPLSEDV